MDKTKAFIVNCLAHPALIYFCILPIYVPIRALAANISGFSDVFHSEMEQLYFFVDMISIVALLGIIVWFVIYLTTKLIHTAYKREEAISILGFFCPIFLMLTTYILLSGRFSPSVLYMAMGVHFYLLRYLGTFVILETKKYHIKDQAVLSNAIKNNLASLIVNSLGILVTIIFVLTSFYDLLLYFTLTTSFLGAVYFYFRYLKKLPSIRCRTVIFCLLPFLLGAVIAMLAGFIMYHWHFFASWLILFSFIAVTIALCYQAKPRYALMYICNLSQYSLVLVTILSSLILFVLSPNIPVKLYDWLYIFEPVFSLVIVIFYLIQIFKQKTEITDQKIASAIFKSSFWLIPFAITIAIMPFDSISIVVIALLVFLLCYAIIEYHASFNTSHIIYINNYSAQTNTLLNIYTEIIRSGLMPVLFILTLSAVNHLYPELAFSSQIISVLLILSAIVFIFNTVSFAYLRKCF